MIMVFEYRSAALYKKLKVIRLKTNFTAIRRMISGADANPIPNSEVIILDRAETCVRQSLSVN